MNKFGSIFSSRQAFRAIQLGLPLSHGTNYISLMKQYETIYPLVTRFERRTGNCPLLLAVITLDQLKNHLRADLPEDLADEVAQRAESVFARNARWRKKFQGRRGNAPLAMFLRPWLAAALCKRQSPLFRRLPEAFKIGQPLPKISLPRQKEMEAPKTARIKHR